MEDDPPVWREIVSVSGVATETIGVRARDGCAAQLQLVVIPGALVCCVLFAVSSLLNLWTSASGGWGLPPAARARKMRTRARRRRHRRRAQTTPPLCPSNKNKGNPGSASFYAYFMRRLHALFDGAVDVVAVSHMGHEPTTAAAAPGKVLFFLLRFLLFLKPLTHAERSRPGRLTRRVTPPHTTKTKTKTKQNPSAGASTRRSATRRTSCSSTCSSPAARPPCCWRTASALGSRCRRWRPWRRRPTALALTLSWRAAAASCRACSRLVFFMFRVVCWRGVCGGARRGA